jgi:hypothetical protein
MFVNILFLCTAIFQEDARAEPLLGHGSFLHLVTESDIKQPTKKRWCWRKQLKLPYWELNSNNAVY